MTAIDFPDTPTIGDTHSATNGTTWVWTGDRWRLKGSEASVGGSGFTYVTDAAPTPAEEGDTWWDSSTGLAFVAYNDPAKGLTWVQFAPGTGSAPPDLGAVFLQFEQITRASPIPNGSSFTTSFPKVAPYNGLLTVTATGMIGFSGAPGVLYDIGMWPWMNVPPNNQTPGFLLGSRYVTPTLGAGDWWHFGPLVSVRGVSKGDRLDVTFRVFNSTGHDNWHFDVAVHAVLQRIVS